MSNIRQAIEALRDYEQADEEGIMVLASRQAIEEVVAALNDTLHARAQAEARAEEAERLLLALAGWAECAVEDTTISAETYWRELPRAIKEARAFIDGKDKS